MMFDFVAKTLFVFATKSNMMRRVQYHPKGRRRGQAQTRAAKVQSAGRKANCVWKERWCMMAEPGIAQNNGNAARKRRLQKRWGKQPERMTLNEANAFSHLPNLIIFCPNPPLLWRKPNAPFQPPVAGWDHQRDQNQISRCRQFLLTGRIPPVGLQMVVGWFFSRCLRAKHPRPQNYDPRPPKAQANGKPAQNKPRPYTNNATKCLQTRRPEANIDFTNTFLTRTYQDHPTAPACPTLTETPNRTSPGTEPTPNVALSLPAQRRFSSTGVCDAHSRHRQTCFPGSECAPILASGPNPKGPTTQGA
jgi:hypothetical protein